MLLINKMLLYNIYILYMYIYTYVFSNRYIYICMYINVYIYVYICNIYVYIYVTYICIIFGLNWGFVYSSGAAFCPSTLSSKLDPGAEHGDGI